MNYFTLWQEFYPFALYGVFLWSVYAYFQDQDTPKKKGSIPRKSPIILSLEGNIGSGKSTLLNEMEDWMGHNPRIAFLAEPVETWNSIVDAAGTTILEKYYENQEKYAFAFQMLAYISRLALLREALKGNYDIIVTERSIYTDRNVFAQMLHDDGKIGEMEYAIYLRWFDEFLPDLPPIKFVYINTNPMVAQERVQMRARPGENIPLEYLENCHAYHKRWLHSTTENAVLKLDGNVDIEKCPEIVDDWLKEINRFLEN